MARPRQITPSYRLHQKTGRGRLVWTDGNGIRHERLLPGLYGSKESLAERNRLQLEIASSPNLALQADAETLTVVEVLSAYLDHAERYYVDPDGNPTKEIAVLKYAMRPVRELYAHTPAASFGPLALKAVRKHMIAAGLTRALINRRIGAVKRIFKWAVSEELVAAGVYEALRSVSGLERGRTEARELPPVLPVDESVVEDTLPHVNRYIRGLIQFQRLTGCRPGEACAVRRCDLDTGGTIWLYRPPHHKGSWRGKTRSISIGPKAQELLRQFFTANFGDYLFSPVRATEEIRAERSAQRVTPRYASHMRRNEEKRRKNPGRRPADRYSHTSYERAVARACDKAFPAPGDLAQREGETRAAWSARLTPAQAEELRTWQQSRQWNPNQLRHLHGTRVRKEFGLEAAQVALGHSRADTTQIYAERNQALAATVASKIG